MVASPPFSAFWLLSSGFFFFFYVSFFLYDSVIVICKNFMSDQPTVLLPEVLIFFLVFISFINFPIFSFIMALFSF